MTLREAEAVQSVNGTPSQPVEVYRIMAERAQGEENEVAWVLLFNTRLRLLAVQEISRGTVNASLIEPAQVFRLAIAYNARGVIVVHNHPSGDPTPSDADITMTLQIQDAAQVLGLTLHDHLIIGKSREISLRSAGYV